MKVSEDAPLVTLAVVTYNSSKTIIETLDSIKGQTYTNIELIISDDKSSDLTVEVCQAWLYENKERFKSTEIIEAVENTGTAGNANRALAKAKGVWIKFFAGDDILPPNSIEEYIKFSYNHPDMKAAFSDELDFLDRFDSNPICYHHLDLRYLAFGKYSSVKLQQKLFSKRVLGLGPTFFIRTEVIKNVGGYDERFPLIDDIPMYIRVLKAGVRIYRIPQALVYYRMSSDSISHIKSSNSYLLKLQLTMINDYKLLYFKEGHSIIWRMMVDFTLLLYKFIIVTGNNKDMLFCRIAYYTNRLLNPMDWYSRFTNLADKLFFFLKIY